MGEHRLKGLVNPEHLWQLVVSDLLSEFPPLYSFNVIFNNLPTQPTALIGREAELNEIMKRLTSEGVRLLTLTGPGGIGKTRMVEKRDLEQLSKFVDSLWLLYEARGWYHAAVNLAKDLLNGLCIVSYQPAPSLEGGN